MDHQDWRQARGGHDLQHNAIMQKVNDQLEGEANQSSEERARVFKEVLHHRGGGGQAEVLMKWEDDSETWEPVDAVWSHLPLMPGVGCHGHSQ